MTSHTVTAMFGTRASAKKAGEDFISQLHLDRPMIRNNPGRDMTDKDYDDTRPYAEKGFFGPLMSL